MLQVIVGSKNPVKVSSVRHTFDRCFPTLKHHVIGYEADSGVAAQPMGCQETLLGATNRISSLKARGQHGLLVAVEGGVERWRCGRYECFAWAAIEHTGTGAVSSAKSGSFMLPPPLAELLDAGMELGAADDKVFGRTRSGQGSGTIGILTGGLLTRTQYYEHTMMLALVPFLNPQLYGKEYDLSSWT